MIFVGRAGRDIVNQGSTTGMAIPSTLRRSGERLTITGVNECATQADSRALAQQVTGLVDMRDETVVPVVWDEDPSQTGYYRVQRAEVGAIDRTFVGPVYPVPWSLELERVDQFGAPLFEIISVGALRTNSVSVVAADSVDMLTLPRQVGNQVWIAGAFGSTYAPSAENRTGASSVVNAVFTRANPAAEHRLTFGVEPATYLTDVPRLEVDYGSGAYRAVVGRQLSRGYADSWRVVNNWMRLTRTGSSDFQMEHWNGSAWSTAKGLNVGITSVTSLRTQYGYGSLTVLRNDTQEVRVRVSVTVDDSATWYDISLRRGHRHALVIPYRATGASAFILGRSSNEAATVLTASQSIRATSNDGDGNRYFIACLTAGASTDTTVGSVTSATATTATFALGLEVTGSSATGQATITQMIRQACAARNVFTRPVGR